MAASACAASCAAPPSEESSAGKATKGDDNDDADVCGSFSAAAMRSVCCSESSAPHSELAWASAASPVAARSAGESAEARGEKPLRFNSVRRSNNARLRSLMLEFCRKEERKKRGQTEKTVM